MRFFERFLRVLHQIGLDKEERRKKASNERNIAQSFTNPAFLPNHLLEQKKTHKKNALGIKHPQGINRSMRASSNNNTNGQRRYSNVRRSKSCPIKKPLKPFIPKIRL